MIDTIEFNVCSKLSRLWKIGSLQFECFARFIKSLLLLALRSLKNKDERKICFHFTFFSQFPMHHHQHGLLSTDSKLWEYGLIFRDLQLSLFLKHAKKY